MRRLVSERGRAGEVDVDSAGIGGWHAGERPDRRAAEAALRRGVRLDGVARQVTPADFEDFDLLLAMDASHLADLRRLAPPGRSGKARIFAAGDVPDPYYGGGEGFETVLDIIEAPHRAGLVGPPRRSSGSGHERRTHGAHHVTSVPEQRAASRYQLPPPPASQPV